MAAGSALFALEVDPVLGPLAASAPPVCWVAGGAPAGTSVGPPLVIGRALHDPTDRRVLVAASDGGPVLCFDVERSCEEILLERYHEGLVPGIEMRVPFNYSRLPRAVKRLGRMLSPSAKAPAAKPFPGIPPARAVDWLDDLAFRLTGTRTARSRRRLGPRGARAALVVTYDVDDDWLLTHPDWIDRFCDLEDRFGVRGAYYCVPMRSRSRAAR